MRDHLACDDGARVEDTDLFKLIVKKYASTLVEAFVDSRLSSQLDDVTNKQKNLKIIYFNFKNILFLI